MNKLQPLRVGIVGTGMQARVHAKSFAAIEGVALAACHDIIEERAKSFAATHNVANVVGTLDDVLGECDVVAIVTPDASHSSIALADDRPSCCCPRVATIWTT
jgi:predicted dehydrogenase